MVHNIRTKEELQDALQKYPNVAIDFFDIHSPESKHVAATFAQCYELDKFKDFRFLKVDIQQLKEASEELGVIKPATFQLYKNGEKVGQVQTDKVEELIEFLESGL